MSTCVANQMWKEKRMVKKDLWEGAVHPGVGGVVLME